MIYQHTALCPLSLQVAAKMGPGAAAMQRAQQQQQPRMGPFVIQAATEVCTTCGAKFKTVGELIQHSEQYHGQQQRRGGRPTAPQQQSGLEGCPYCRRTFADPVALVAHVDKCPAAGGAKKSECRLI